MIGTAIQKTLSAVGVTSERVTAVGQAVGVLEPGQDCGCTQRVNKLDKWTQAAVTTIQRSIPRRAKSVPKQERQRVIEGYAQTPCGRFIDGTDGKWKDIADGTIWVNRDEVADCMRSGRTCLGNC